MVDKELRKLIGSRAKQRRLELGLNQQYVAEKMDVNKSTIQRYEAGTIDNTKKLVLEGLASALHVSVEWLKGETEEYASDITDERDLQLKDIFGRLTCLEQEELKDEEFAFSKDLLIYMLSEYESFLDSFRSGCEKYKGSQRGKNIAKTTGFDSVKEYNEVMFLREITHSINAFNDIEVILRNYSKDSDDAYMQLKRLLQKD
ncbi:MAG: helix-turn-helix transcriptional regulator [Clostridiales bacterium]|nr:helix-turn-helix transcriptional regulator [Clostridiales bacterium]